MDAQTVARDALIAQAAEHKQLAEIDQEQAIKVRAILLGESRAEAARQKRTQWKFFILGVAVSIPVGFAINVLTCRL